MDNILHDDSLKVLKDAAEDCTSKSALVLPYILGQKFVLGKFFENVSKWSKSQSYHDKSDIRRLLLFFPQL